VTYGDFSSSSRMEKKKRNEFPSPLTLKYQIEKF